MRQVLFYRSRGGGLICGYRWKPDGEIKAIVQIVHGIADHASRYEPFAEYLNSQGFLVVAEDHMGHGESICDDAPQGYFSGGWFAGVDDTYQLYLDTRKLYPDVPYVIFGHSMGSFITRSILIRYPDSGIDFAILSGTGWMNPVALRSGRMMADLVCRKHGDKYCSPLLQKMMFGNYNARIKNPRTEYDWLNRDEKQVDAYIADPLCGFIPTAGLVRDLMDGIIYIQDPKNMARMSNKTRIYFIGGQDDPVAGYGLGTRLTAKKFCKAGIEYPAMSIHSGRHELLFEKNKESIYETIVNWLDLMLQCMAISKQGGHPEFAFPDLPGKEGARFIG